MNLIYVSSPYSHPLASQREARFKAACKYAARLVIDGYNVFSPIAHSHPLCEVGGAPNNHDTWMPRDLEVLGRCNEMHVLKLDGWDRSKGVLEEMRHARVIGIPVVMVEGTCWEELPGPPPEQSILLEAERLVNGPRNADYGSYQDESRKIAQIATDLLKKPIEMTDLATIMIVTKLVRESNKHKRDNLVDICGYAELQNRLCDQ